MAKYIVTIAPPTPNGNLHLGHLSGPFLSADVFARLQRIKNHEVFFTCYSDDHQSYLLRKAVQVGENPLELAGHYCDEIKRTLNAAKISVDWFMKSGNNSYFFEAVKYFYQGAKAKHAIGKKMDEVPYSAEEKIYGYEGFATATCNFCGSSSDASQCEGCGYPPTMNQMGDFKSVFTQKPLGKIKVEREYLKLDIYKDLLLKKYDQKSRVREKLNQYIQEVLDKVSSEWFIDRPGESGITINVDSEDHVIHTWFSGIAGYIAATKEYDAKNDKKVFEEFWLSKDTKLVQFLGFDCSFSHAIVYPSLLSNHEELVQDNYVFTNEFLKLENKDFSTSRGHAIWVNDFLNEYSLDAARYYLAIYSPEEKVSNFSKNEFIQWNEEFTKAKEDLLNNFIVVSEKKISFDLVVNKHSEALSKVMEAWNRYSSVPEYSMKKLATELYVFLKYINQYCNNDETEMVLLYSILGEAIHPDFSLELKSKYQFKNHNSFEVLKALDFHESYTTI